ncbi:MAG: threonine--tRNA ligase [Planctomycetota bacterium]|nr:threonine--tRNA ligase [Planctomycetota bacterium]
MSDAMVTVTLPDGSTRSLTEGANGADLAADVGPGLAKAALAIVVNGEMKDLALPLPDGSEVAVVTTDSEEGLDLMRHSTAHVMAQAVMDLFGGENVRLGIGPTIKHGFYYDFDFEDDRRLREEDLETIEGKMAEIVAADQSFVREEVSRGEALERWESQGDRYKCDLIAAIPEGESISFYHNAAPGSEEGAFVDLCRGPHVSHTGALSGVVFKLLSIAGAYWKGDVAQPMMQRVYAACFADQKDLDRYLENLEEARKRDHRKLGKELKLFHFTDTVGQGLPLWLPKGAQVIESLVDFLRAEQKRRGYLSVITPHIGKQALYETSGHWENYQDSIFPPMEEPDGSLFVLKPMNCPHHIEIYRSDLRSYRDLPLRFAEFGTVYRHEQSGELGGLKRVRGFTVDDAHLFVTPDQLQDEFRDVVGLVQMVLKTLHLTDVHARVGVRDDDPEGKWVGDAEHWDRAQGAIVQACEDMGLDFTVDVGEAAFYGPKLDFVVTDALDREWQLGTVQVDYNLPERFDLKYTGPDGSRQRPVMIHRAPFGSLERFMGVLIEHCGGEFPLWLSPVQVVVAPISDEQNERAEELACQLDAAGFRVKRDFANEPIGAKIKRAHLEKLPYVAILGPREISESGVSLRSRDEGDLGVMSVEAFFERLRSEVENRS